MAKDNCKESFIPITDNTPLDCPQFVEDKCLIVPTGNTFLNTNDDEDLKSFHTKLIEKLIEFNQSIITLSEVNPGLASYEFTLVNNVLSLAVNGSVVATQDLQSLLTGGAVDTKQVYIATGGETSITLGQTINTLYPNQVTIGGITALEGSGNDYQINNNTVTFTSSPLVAGEVVQIFYKY